MLDIDTVETFPFDILRYAAACHLPVGRQSYFSSRKYIDIISTFDIETTALDDIQQSILWHWQVCIDGLVCVGRTWDEFKLLLQRIDENLASGICFVFYVHNLSYEFQFLRAIHNFKPDEVFCLTGRKIAKCNIGNRFEFRCSYILTNMSLREFLKNMKVEHLKTEMDYSVKRYPWTEVSASDLKYCIADVLGLYEALHKKFKIDRNSNQNVPMTSTGYVRNDFRKAMRAGGYLPLVHDCSPSYDVYLMIRRAFRGGDTHSNRFYTSVILDNITSYDRSSSYPDVLVNYPYPIASWKKQKITKLEQLEDGFPYLIQARFYNIRMRDEFDGHPYLAVHKCYDLVNHVDDNGRVLEAKALTIYFTDIDLQIIRDQYVWSTEIVYSCYRSEYGMLPDAMRNLTMDYYRKKTELKGVDGQEVYYAKAKALLNSIYGMCATNPVRTSLIFNGKDFDVVECREEDKEKWATATDQERKELALLYEKELLSKANKKAFTAYVWGCWCTAYARLMLHKAIKLCGHKFVYCDTDSVKFIGHVDFTELNAEIQALSEKHGAYADDPSGKRHYLGVYECESKHPGEPTYKRYCTLGAKKYAYEDMNGQLHITIAGVSKDGYQELGELENFQEGFVFTESAGMEAVYNDDWHDPVVIDGHTVEIPPNIYLHKSEYTLGVTQDYRRLFNLSQEQFDRIIKTR